MLKILSNAVRKFVNENPKTVVGAAAVSLYAAPLSFFKWVEKDQNSLSPEQAKERERIMRDAMSSI